MPNTFEGDLNGQGLRIAIAVSRFSKVKKNGKPLGQVLLEGCLERLRDAGVDEEDIYISWVPGAFELPLVAKAFAEHGFEVDDDADDDEDTDETDEFEESDEDYNEGFTNYEEKNLRQVVGNGNGNGHDGDEDDDDADEITIEGAIVEHEHFDAVITLGCIIRGETPHFDYIAGETARGIATIGLSTDVPIIFGVLTCNSEEQALERAGGGAGHVGIEAAEAALETATLHLRMRAWEPKQ
ncbi:MAG: 6,7-dimethyl-8-ribityllumazine synthase [Planctomycetota bacterium]